MEYKTIPCVELITGVVHYAFNKAQYGSIEDKKRSYLFSRTPMFAAWCDVYEFDVDRMKNEMLKYTL